ncbi:unnamed protein product, partial [Mesorhabditis belari]|uniref:Ion transport domain-containing protein n=1 Tax=Mesorhabditis belari TaxID=2138241 RepID=A0AAF3J4T6_9BILA
MRRLIEKFPQLAELVMEQCKSEDEKNKEITYDFQLIDDPFLLPDELVAKNEKGRAIMTNGSVQSDAQLYSNNGSLIYRDHPIMLMANSENPETRALLAHPLVVKLLEKRWSEFGLFFSLWLSILPYFIFLLSFMIILLSNEKCSSVQTTPQHYTATIKFSLEEKFSLTERSECTLDGNNQLEILIYILCPITIFFQPSIDTSPDKKQIFWIFSCFVVMLSSINLLILISTLKNLGIFLRMLVKVSHTVFKLTPMFCFLVAAFASSFILLLQDEKGFVSFSHSFLTTLVMSTGEINYLEVFHADETSDKFWMKVAARYLLVLFIAVVVIMAINVLTGRVHSSCPGVLEREGFEAAEEEAATNPKRGPDTENVEERSKMVKRINENFEQENLASLSTEQLLILNLRSFHALQKETAMTLQYSSIKKLLKAVLAEEEQDASQSPADTIQSQPDLLVQPESGPVERYGPTIKDDHGAEAASRNQHEQKLPLQGVREKNDEDKEALEKFLEKFSDHYLIER